MEVLSEQPALTSVPLKNLAFIYQLQSKKY